MLTPRPRDEIEAQYAKAWVMLLGTRRDGGTATVTQIVIAMAGVHEALGWVLGRTPWSPLSGRDLPNPGPAELLSEYARAEAVRHRSRVLPVGMDREAQRTPLRLLAEGAAPAVLFEHAF
jgi:hypothetical protein